MSTNTRTERTEWTDWLRGRLRASPYASGLVVVFMGVGAGLAPNLFPNLPTTAAILGGALFGFYAALLASMHKFLE